MSNLTKICPSWVVFRTIVILGAVLIGVLSFWFAIDLLICNSPDDLPRRVIGFFTMFLGVHAIPFVLVQLTNLRKSVEKSDDKTVDAPGCLGFIVLVFVCFVCIYILSFLNIKPGNSGFMFFVFLVISVIALYLTVFVLCLIFSLISKMLSFIPFLEEFDRTNWISSVLIAAVLSLILTAIVWMPDFPMSALILLSIAWGLLHFLKYARRLMEIPSFELQAHPRVKNENDCRENFSLCILDTFVATLFGLSLLFISLIGLFLGESLFVHKAQVLEQKSQIVISTYTDYIDESNDGMLIHLSGKATTRTILKDSLFDLTVDNAIKLRRVVEKYQWKDGGYSWSEPENPYFVPFSGKTFIAQQITLGGFILSSSLVDKINHYQWLAMEEYRIKQVQENFSAYFPDKKLHFYSGNYYIGKNPAHPLNGDLRIRFEIVPFEIISIVAKQLGSSWLTYITHIGGDIELLEYGAVSADKMFQHAKIESQIVIDRLIALIVVFLMMFLCVFLIVAVLAILSDIVPFLAIQLNFLMPLVITVSLFLITIAIAWVNYSLMLGITLFVIAVGFLVLLKFAAKRQEPKFELQAQTLVSEMDVPYKK